MVLAHLESGLVFDHTERTVRAIGDIDVRDALGDEHVADAFAPAETPAPTAITWRHDESAYLSLIAECQRLIGDGETYQICLCNEAVVDVDADPVAVFRRLRRRSPTHHGALFRIDDLALVSGSPEQFLTLSGGRIVTRPMKGTRPRGIGEADDDLARELHDSEKERAENLMIADLMRNDLARVAEVGSVAVTELFGVEHYATVHQLVSTVEATLAHGRSVVDLLRATQPAGSMTGAPKHSAMGAIARLEAGPRGVFSGAFGRFDAEGGADLAVVIRSILLEPGRATIGVGGGITALSLPEDEYDETMLKAESMLWALGAVSTRSR
jgi:anthranilate/para-aminobenzoate synthase component I